MKNGQIKIRGVRIKLISKVMLQGDSTARALERLTIHPWVLQRHVHSGRLTFLPHFCRFVFVAYAWADAARATGGGGTSS